MMNSSMWFLYLALSVFTLMLIAGCSAGQDEDLRAYVADVKARAAEPIDELPPIKIPETFAYILQNDRSPFKAYAANLIAAIGSDINRPKEELEAYPLDALRLVGRLTKNKQVWAIVQAPDNSVHYITVGGHLGQNFGKVVAIRDDSLDVMELLPSSEGSWEKHPATMALQQNDQGRIT